MSITDQIKSVRQTLGRDFKRPPREKLDTMMAALRSDEGLEAMTYLKNERGFSQETIDHFNLGYDSGRNAVAIPIFKGEELINIKYRFLKPDKVRYTSESGAETWIYHDKGIEYAKQKGGVLIVEGEFDLMSCYQNGVKNVISPASGKDSYGVWLEMIDTIPRVYVAYDNDEPGKKTAFQLAERVGVEKSYEVKYPVDVKDANEFFKKHTREDFLAIIKNSTPYYSYEFKNVGDIILEMMQDQREVMEFRLLPNVRVENDWLIVVSGETNIGKTGYVLNIAKELGQKGIPSLIMPFERGIVSVGKRFLQILFDKTAEAMQYTTKDEWEKLINKFIDLPTYFAMPKRDEVEDTIKKAKRIFNTQVVIIDHLDYMVRQTGRNENKETAEALQSLKGLAMEAGVVMIVVTHLRKGEGGAMASKRPNIKDLKGSSSVYQDPECVVLLSSPEPGKIDVDIAKNKGKMGVHTFNVNQEIGTYGTVIDPDDF